MRSALFALLGLACAIAVVGLLPPRLVRRRSTIAILACVVVALAATPVISHIRHRGDVVPMNVSQLCAHADLRPGTASGSVDIVRTESGAASARGLTAGPDSTLDMQGWADRAQHTAIARAACLVLDGHIVGAATAIYATPRPDVAAAYHNPVLAGSGFELRWAVRSLAGSGRHTVGVAVIDSPADSDAVLLPRTSVLVVP